MLKYTGTGTAYFVGVPARDLEDDEIGDLLELTGLTREQLVASGVYEESKAPAQGPPAGGNGEAVPPPPPPPPASLNPYVEIEEGQFSGGSGGGE